MWYSAGYQFKYPVNFISGLSYSDVDSWFLEAKTASQYDHYEKFYNEALKKRVICPKLYSSVC